MCVLHVRLNTFSSVCVVTITHSIAYSATWYSPEGGEVIDVSLQRCVGNILNYSVPPLSETWLLCLCWCEHYILFQCDLIINVSFTIYDVAICDNSV